MDAITPKAKHDTLDTHSHVVRPATMEGKKTRFPGCEVKGLLFDKESGVVTALMKFAPGAVLPDHEHVKIEQTYVLEGKLVDKEGPAKDLTVGPGEFVWREAGSRHVACTPEGGLMLVHELQYRRRIGSSSWAKKALATLRISLARRSSAFSRRSATSSSRSGVDSRSLRSPASASSWRIQLRSASGCTPS